MEIEQLEDIDKDVSRSTNQQVEVEYEDPSMLSNEELIDLYKKILEHITFLNEHVINLDEGGSADE